MFCFPVDPSTTTTTTIEERQLDGLGLPLDDLDDLLPTLPIPTNLKRQIKLPVHVPVNLEGLGLPVDLPLPLPTILDVPSTGLKARQLEDLGVPLDITHLGTDAATGTGSGSGSLLSPLDDVATTVTDIVEGVAGRINL